MEYEWCKNAEDFGVAARWYEQAAAAGDLEAQNRLGMLYQSDLGPPKDYERARLWLERAALAGSMEAQRNMGFTYLRGLGVEQDRENGLSGAGVVDHLFGEEHLIGP